MWLPEVATKRRANIIIAALLTLALYNISHLAQILVAEGIKVPIALIVSFIANNDYWNIVLTGKNHLRYSSNALSGLNICPKIVFQIINSNSIHGLRVVAKISATRGCY